MRPLRCGGWERQPMASLDDPGEVREGFLCPLCLKDLQSFYQLQSHYEEEHSGEDRDVKGQIKSKRLGFPAYPVLSLGALTHGMVFISSHGCHCGLKKDVQVESCELSFIWGKMRTAALEAASQIALRDCSKAEVGVSQYIRFWWSGGSIPWSTQFTTGFLLVMRVWCHQEGI